MNPIDAAKIAQFYRALDADAKSILKQSSGKLVTITCTYRDPSQVTMNASPLVFRVK